MNPTIEQIQSLIHKPILRDIDINYGPTHCLFHFGCVPPSDDSVVTPVVDWSNADLQQIMNIALYSLSNNCSTFKKTDSF